MMSNAVYIMLYINLLLNIFTALEVRLQLSRNEYK